MFGLIVLLIVLLIVFAALSLICATLAIFLPPRPRPLIGLACFTMFIVWIALAILLIMVYAILFFYLGVQ